MKYINYLAERFNRFLFTACLAAILDATFIFAIVFTWCTYFSQQAQDDKIYEIYNKLLVQTGQAQDALPLSIFDDNIDNAYNDGEQIVIYRGLINHSSWDSIALVLGHEIAHGMLGHLGKLSTRKASEIAVLEANADKMGAFYMMKAGYDLCKGRELYRIWKEENGNALGQSHPDYSYRYDELNINCD